MKDSDKQIKEMLKWLFEQLEAKTVVIKRVYKDDYEKIDKCELPFIVMDGEAKIEKGDLVIVKEWDSIKKQDTGRYIERRVLSVNKVDTKNYFSIEKIRKEGLLVLEI